MRVETQIRGCSLYRSDRPGLRTHGARLRCSTAVSRACVHPRGRPRAALLAAAIFAAACGGGQLTAPLPLPTPGNATPASIAESVTDGDTIRFSPPQLGSSSVRYLDIDAPELGGATQEPWAARSRDNLRALLAPGTPITITLDQQAVDSFGRVLGHVRRASDGLNTNREQVRAGHAVLYVIWPNVAGFLDYRGAQIEAQDAGAGVWSPAQPLRELPFEYRARIDGRPLFRPVGDYLTRRYVDPASHTLVHVNNRVFFGSDAEARTAGYEPCPRGPENRYSAACFAPGQ